MAERKDDDALFPVSFGNPKGSHYDSGLEREKEMSARAEEENRVRAQLEEQMVRDQAERIGEIVAAALAPPPRRSEEPDGLSHNQRIRRMHEAEIARLADEARMRAQFEERAVVLGNPKGSYYDSGLTRGRRGRLRWPLVLAILAVLAGAAFALFRALRH